MRTPRSWLAHVAAFTLLGLVLAIMAWTNVQAHGATRQGLAARESWLFLVAFGVSAGALAELWARGRDEQNSAQSSALVDPLTRLPNRPATDAHLDGLLSSARRHGTNLGLLMIDVDHFRRINRSFGHVAGDQVLRSLASRIRPCLRGEDFAGRWSGEEFIILLPMTDTPGTATVAERVRDTVALSLMSSTGMDLSVTVSIGGVLSRADEDAPSLLTRAGEALQAARKNGRNCVVIAPPTGDGIETSGIRVGTPAPDAFPSSVVLAPEPG